MVFEDVNLDDLGVIEQEISFGATDDKKVKIAIVPEPAPLSLLGFGGSVLALRRSRRTGA
ncbi:MAG: PEP-CTERM sorting domain-containing protein [Verrucomicrobiaceae bacterium]|nr:MAG: PEP-CTERM sorting domain-containing protein [Verrucomicrobiaceae bacterium]